MQRSSSFYGHPEVSCCNANEEIQHFAFVCLATTGCQDEGVKFNLETVRSCPSQTQTTQHLRQLCGTVVRHKRPGASCLQL